MEIQDLFVQWTALVGIAALIAVLINVLKLVGVVKDGDAPTWSAGFNLAGMIGLLVLRVFKPEFDVSIIDEQAAALANVLIVVIGYITQLLSSKFAHIVLKGAKFIGTSYSVEAAKAKSFAQELANKG